MLTRAKAKTQYHAGQRAEYGGRAAGHGGAECASLLAGGNVLTMAKNIAEALNETSGKRIIWITGMGIHHITCGTPDVAFTETDARLPARLYLLRPEHNRRQPCAGRRGI